MLKNVLQVSDCDPSSLEVLLRKYHLKLEIVAANTPIPGSYWGDSEAGLVSSTLYVRGDTPVHSLLHETCHYICMDSVRRSKIDTNAEGDYDEENGVCYLQILLSADIPEMGMNRMLEDMDAWGYTFRLGSAKAWFNQDAEDAVAWLENYHVVGTNGKPTYRLRDA